MKGFSEASVLVISFWAVMLVVTLYSWLALASYCLDLLVRFMERFERERNDVHERVHDLMNKKGK